MRKIINAKGKMIDWLKICGLWLSILIIVIVLIYGFYINISAYTLIGRQVSIDGKILTITAAERNNVILSDRTRIDVNLAEKLLINKQQ